MTLPLFPSSMLPFAEAPARATRGEASSSSHSSVAQLATLYGVGAKADKTEENAAIAAHFAARYPADRLLPMPSEIHADWTAEEVEQVRTHSERLAAADGNARLANSWRLRLREPRGLYWMRMDARERITTSAERRAALLAGQDVDPRITFRSAGLDQFPPAPQGIATPPVKGKRRRSAAADASLSARMLAGCCVLSVSWGDPSVPVPGGLPRDVWAFAVPAGEDLKEIHRIYAPETTPGDGWVHGQALQSAPGPKWSEEAKGRVRRRNLRKRLDAKVPLFAQALFDEEVARRPDYFAGKPVLSAVPVEPDNSMIGHNGGPRLDPL